MNKTFSRLLSLSLWQLVALLCLGGSLMSLIAWRLWDVPVEQQAVGLMVQQRKYARQYQAQLQRLMMAGSLTQKEAEIAQLYQVLQPERAAAFSLLALTETSGGSLTNWQPVGEGGSLTLLLSWHQVASVFSYLSSLPFGVELLSFSLKPEAQRLQFQLLLGLEDEK